jgi:hypothetical protein
LDLPTLNPINIEIGKATGAMKTRRARPIFAPPPE